MSEWEIKLPITAIAYLVVEADSEEDAIQRAFEEVTLKDVEEWEAVERITQGNVCYALRPWEAEAVRVSDE